jgi:Domain of unknown function (DUF4359)
MRNNLFKGGVALTVVAIIMGFTNPKQESYNDYASNKLIQKAEQSLCKQFGYCDGGEPPIFVKNTIIKPAINASTQRQNLVLFSLYKTELPGIGTYKSFGALGNFITYSES